MTEEEEAWPFAPASLPWLGSVDIVIIDISVLLCVVCPWRSCRRQLLFFEYRLSVTSTNIPIPPTLATMTTLRRRACRKITYRGHRRQLRTALLILAVIYYYSDHCDAGSTLVVATAAATAAAPTTKISTSSSTAAEPPPTSSSSNIISPKQVVDVPVVTKMIQSFFDKFDSVGPTLTLTLRDPISMGLLGSSSSSESNRPCYYFGKGGGGDLLQRQMTSSQKTSFRPPPSPGQRRRRDSVTLTTIDDGTFGLSSKLAALFHISPSTTTTTTHTNNYHGRPYSQIASTSSSSNIPSASQFADGYMLDDGDIFLEPPSSSSSSIDGGNASSSSGLFSMRNIGENIMKSGWGRSWSECMRNIHPELMFEMHAKRRQPQSLSTIISPVPTTTTCTTITNHEKEEMSVAFHDAPTRPFPIMAPWLTALSFRTKWSPFPIYDYYYPEDANNGYGHKLLLSKPHFVRARAKISIPRFSSLVQGGLTSKSLGIAKQFTLVNDDDGGGGGGGDSNSINHSKNNNNNSKEVDLSITYQKRPYSTSHYCRGDGTVELVLGTSISTLSPATTSQSRAILDKYRKNNHLLVRLGTGRGIGGTSNTNGSKRGLRMIPLSSIEYVKGSFRIPNPLFLCRKGVSISPSYNFLEGNARCVFSGDVGSSGRTRAVLRLDAFDSTLTVVRALDDK